MKKYWFVGLFSIVFGVMGDVLAGGYGCNAQG